MNKSVSPSRTYVAVCSKPAFDGYYFRKFTLPENIPGLTPRENDSETASWYFLNQLDAFSCIDGCFAFEDFLNVRKVKSNFGNLEKNFSEKIKPLTFPFEVKLSAWEFFQKIKKYLEEKLDGTISFSEEKDLGIIIILWKSFNPERNEEVYFKQAFLLEDINYSIDPFDFIINIFIEKFNESFKNYGK